MQQPKQPRGRMVESTTAATIHFNDGRTFYIDEELPFRVHVENAAKLPNVRSIESTDGSRQHYFNER